MAAVLLSLTSTADQATDLGYVLHKHPDRVRSVDVGFGVAHVFFPEATAQRCTACLYVEVDPIRLGQRRRRARARPLEPYVSDRPYAASSLLSVAIGRVFGTALAGSCEQRPELVDQPVRLEVSLPVVPVHGGEELARRLFEPLRYDVACRPLPLDERFADWGRSRYVGLELDGEQTVREALAHLFVLLPVLDDDKHYWVGDEEVDKLLRRGGDWLAAHPDRELIARRYVRHKRHLAREALARLSDEPGDPDATDDERDESESQVERPLGLADRRLDAVTGALVAVGARRVVDLGCGEGKLLERLLNMPSIEHVLGVDVSAWALERAERRLRLDQLSQRRREQIALVQGALTYRDERIEGFDAATLVEVIEHVDEERLDVLASIVFEHARPETVIVTTPNREYNALFDRLGASDVRHGDHRFEWTRAELAAWAGEVGSTFGYAVELSGIGDEHPDLGSPTQMALFTR